MATSTPPTGQQALASTIDMLHLPADMLTELEIKHRIELLESLLEEDETDVELILKLEECRNALANSTYFQHPEYFKLLEENDLVTSDRDKTTNGHVKAPTNPLLIDETNFPFISLHFKHWIDRLVFDNDFKPYCLQIHQTDIPTAKHLLKQLEGHLGKVEDAISSGQLHKDPTLRKFFYVKIAITLHDIHSKLFSDRLDAEDKSETKNGEDQLDCDQVHNMVSLGIILFRMCYPPDTPQLTHGYLYELVENIRTECPFEVDPFIANDVHLLILLLGCSEINRTYLDVGLCSLYRWYDNLSDLGKEEPVAVARAFDIEKYCVYNHFRHKMNRDFVPLIPEYEDLATVD